MSTRASNLLLLSSAVVLSHLIILFGSFTRPFFNVVYHVKLDQLDQVMPLPTRLASNYSWVFGVLLGLTVAMVALASMHHIEKKVQLLALALCAQGFVFWIAMFCFCYDGFLGPMSLHHGPDFDFSEFLQFGYGVFPVALIALLVPASAVFFCKGSDDRRRKISGTV
jgi:hypothetical protein